MSINQEQAAEFLNNHFDEKPSNIELIGAGAWSQCFGFQLGRQELAIRFGQHVEDFRKDQLACAYASANLPIPEVTEIGEAFDGYFAISTRAHGVPLESVKAAQWQSLVPSLASAMEAMRLANISSNKGIGGWGMDGNALDVGWRDYLLMAGVDSPGKRTYGWRKQLETSPVGIEAFEWGYDLLQRMATDDVPRCLAHCDLINRNVLVAGDKITGVFDWGCSIYGDHLYELAWFDFWSPWFPELDMQLLHSALERRWRDAGYSPANKDARLAACYLHIGLDHLGYNAYQGDWANVIASAERMRALIRI